MWIGVCFGWGVAENGRFGSAGRGGALSGKAVLARPVDKSHGRACPAALVVSVVVIPRCLLVPVDRCRGLLLFPEYKPALSPTRVTALRFFDPTLDYSRRFHSQFGAICRLPFE
jgi:hypothetical protein